MFHVLNIIFNFCPAAAKSLQSCLTLCDPTDGSPPGSPAPGILQARTPEWVAISFSNAWTWKVKRKSLSRVRLLATPWTTAYQAPPSMGFSRQEYWSGVPLPSPSFCPHYSKSLVPSVIIQLIPFTLSALSQPLPSGNHYSVHYIYLFSFCLFILFLFLFFF